MGGGVGVMTVSDCLLSFAILPATGGYGGVIRLGGRCCCARREAVVVHVL